MANNSKARRRLSNIRPKEVSLVDEAANLRDFIVVKRKGKGKTNKELFKSENPGNPDSGKVLGTLTKLKSQMSEEQAGIIDSAISKLQTLSPELEHVSTDDNNVTQTSGGSDMTDEEKTKMEELEKSIKDLSDKNTALTKDKDDKDKAEKEKAETEKADKEKADKEKADKEKAETEKADKEKADKEKADKEKSDKEKSDEETAKAKKIDDMEKEIAELKKSANPPSSDDDDGEAGSEGDENLIKAARGDEKIEKNFWGGAFS